jgi:hypothetical protein
MSSRRWRHALSRTPPSNPSRDDAPSTLRFTTTVNGGVGRAPFDVVASGTVS